MWKKILLSVVVLIAVLGVAAVFALNPLVEKFRPQILALLSQQLGHKVAFDDLKLSLLPTAGVEVRNIRFLETDTENFAVPRVLLKTSLLGIARGDITVSELRVESARLRVTKRKDGSLAIGELSLVKKSPETPARENDGGERRETKRVSSEEKSVALNVDEAAFDSLDVFFTDESVDPPRELAVENLSGRFSLRKNRDTTTVSGTLDAKDSALRFADLFAKERGAELNATFDLAVSRGNVVESKQLVVKFAGSTIEATGTLFPLEAAEADVALQGVNLAALSRFLPPLRAFDPAGALTGQVHIGDHAPGQPPVAEAQGAGPKFFGTFALSGLAGAAKIPPKDDKPGGEIRATGGTGEIRLDDDTVSTKGFTLTVAGS